MKTLLWILILLLNGSIVHAQFEEPTKVYAFACAWDDGDIVFSTSVGVHETKVTRTYEQGKETVKVTIEDLQSRVTYAKVLLSAGKRISAKSAKCLMEQE